MANEYSRGRGRGFDERSERSGGRGRTEQQGYEEERWRRNQEWSPSQDSGYQGGGPSHDESSPFGYGASGMEDSERGGQGDFRSSQGRNQYGYGASGQGGYGGTSDQYGSGEMTRRQAQQGRYSGGHGQQGFGQGRYGDSQYGEGQYGSTGGYETGSGRSGSHSGEFGSQAGYGYGSQSGRYGTQQGGFKGRGPKGYTRSDQRIEEDVNERLFDDDYIDASNIEVQVSSGTVTLAGHVENRESRRRAEDLVESCSGVQQVQNNILVKSGASYGNGPERQDRTSMMGSQSSSEATSKKAGSGS